MKSQTKRRACPTCCPDGGAIFRPSYDVVNEWVCANCALAMVIKARKPQVGGPKQKRVVDRIRAQLAKRFEVEDADPDHYWSSRGIVALYARPKSVWASDGQLIYVGVRGSVKLTACDDGTIRRGFDALTWLSILAL
jgi:hypothetical protein